MWVNSSNRFLSVRWSTFVWAGAVICLTLFQPATAAVPQSQPLPSGYALYLRLETAVSTAKSHLNDAVKARVIREVDSAGGVLIPSGAEVQGKIEKLVPSSSASDRACPTRHYSSEVRLPS